MEYGLPYSCACGSLPFCYVHELLRSTTALAILKHIKKTLAVKGRELVIPPVTLLDTSDHICISAPCNGGIRQNLVCNDRPKRSLPPSHFDSETQK